MRTLAIFVIIGGITSLHAPLCICNGNAEKPNPCAKLSHILEEFRQPLTRAERDLIKDFDGACNLDRLDRPGAPLPVELRAEDIGAKEGLPRQARGNLQAAIQFMLGKLVILPYPLRPIDTSENFIAGKIIKVTGTQKKSVFQFEITIRRASGTAPTGAPEEVTVRSRNGAYINFLKSPEDKFLNNKLTPAEKRLLEAIPFLNLDDHQAQDGGILIEVIPEVPKLSPIQEAALRDFQKDMVMAGWRQGLPPAAYLALKDGIKFLTGKLIAQATASEYDLSGGDDLDSHLVVEAGKVVQVTGEFNNVGDPLYQVVMLTADNALHTTNLWVPHQPFIFESTLPHEADPIAKESTLAQRIHILEVESCAVDLCTARVKKLAQTALQSIKSKRPTHYRIRSSRYLTSRVEARVEKSGRLTFSLLQQAAHTHKVLP